MLLLVALIAGFAHVCVLPGHAHVEGHHHDDAHAPAADASRDSAVHAASCEAVRAPATGLTPPAVVFRVDAPVAVALAVVEPVLPAPRATASPPLFLLHAALLI